MGVVKPNHNMATKEELLKEDSRSHYTGQGLATGSPVTSRSVSPAVDRLTAVQREEEQEERMKRSASPRLPLTALEELKSADKKRQEIGWDSDDPPLSTPWTFWFQRTTTQTPFSYGAADPKNFSEGLRVIYTVRSIKEFFSVYNNIRPADQLALRECYHLMRHENRRPMWEDLDNINGGTWTFKCKKEDTVSVWQELLLAAIGEQFSNCTAEDDDVVGVSVKGREYENQFQIWNENSSSVKMSTVMDRIRQLLPGIEIRDFYTSTKERLVDVSQPFSSHQPRSVRGPTPFRPHLPSGVSPYQYYPRAPTTTTNVFRSRFTRPPV